MTTPDDVYRPAEPQPDDDLFATEDDVFNRPRRTNRWTRLLLGALAVVIGFGGGVLAQKSHDAGLVSSTAASTGFRARPGTGAGGASGFGGGSGGFGGAPAGVGPAGGSVDAGRGAGGAGGAGAGGATGVPTVVGTVTAVSGTHVTVTNFAGATVVVVIGPATTVTTRGATGLVPGLSVSVVGTKAGDGTVTADSVAARRPSAG